MGSEPRRQADMLPLVVRPLSGESVVSLIGRQADAVCAPFSAMRAHFGIRANFMLSDENWTRLADALGLEEADLSDMRRMAVTLGLESGGVAMLGTTLRHHLVNHGALRVCPACVGEGHPLLERWDIAHAPICLRHGKQLVDTCQCGRQLSRRYRGHKISNSCPCGMSYAELKAKSARPGLVTVGEIVDEALAGRAHAALDPDLRRLPLSDLLCIMHVVGVAATTPAKDDRDVEPRGAVYGSVRIGEAFADVTSMADLVEVAAPYLLTWSVSYPELLGDVAGRNQTSGIEDADAAFATAIGRTLRRPPRGIDGIPLECMTAAVESFCAERFGIRPRKASHRRNSPVARKIAPHVTRRRIATTLGVAAQSPALTRIFDEAVRSLDEDGVAMAKNAKALAVRVERLVLRRWHNTQGTVSLDQATRRLSHKSSCHSPGDWIHPELLVPIDDEEHGVDGVLSKRRRGVSFHASDVEVLLDRIASRAHLVNAEADMDGFLPFAQCRKFHGGGWPRTDFLLAFLSGRIPARALNERPRIADIWFHRETVRDLALEHRVKALLAKDPFAVAYRCRALVSEVWGKPADHMSDYHLRHLRKIKAVRFVDVRNTTGGRDRPLYHYPMVDVLERARLIQGASVTPLLDLLIDAHRASRPADTRIVPDDEQVAANIYLAGLASNAMRSLPGHREVSTANFHTSPPPAGWRRGGGATAAGRASASTL